MEDAAMEKKTTDIDAVLNERGSRYGKFASHANLTMELKTAIHVHWDEQPDKAVPADVIEALHMICHKIGRIVNGDHEYADSWVDIAGYAQLVADRIEGNVR
jgi:hypothetical protein